MSKKFCGVILKTSYDRMGETASIDILGKSMLDWVKLALSDVPVAVADYDATVELPVALRPFVAPDCDYMVVLFSDTPLVTRKTVASVVEEAYNSRRSVLKMTRGYVFECKFILNADKIYSNDTVYFDEEDFITAFNFKQVGLITDILKNRILDFHMEQGVRFTDLTGTVIGCDVSIERGAVIGYGNILLGKTRIGSGANIGNGNRLTDCIVKSGATVGDTVANRVVIGQNASVGPFAVLSETVVGDNAKIGSFVTLNGANIGNGDEIFASSVAMKKIVKDEPKVETQSETQPETVAEETQSETQPEIVVEDTPTPVVDETIATEPVVEETIALEETGELNETVDNLTETEETVEELTETEEVAQEPTESEETVEELTETEENTEVYLGEVEQVNPDEIAPKYDYFDEIDAVSDEN